MKRILALTHYYFGAPKQPNSLYIADSVHYLKKIQLPCHPMENPIIPGLKNLYNKSLLEDVEFLTGSPYLTTKIMLLYLVQFDPSWLSFAEATLRDDREIALHAVSKQGTALQFVSERLQNHKKIVLSAVKQNGLAL